MSQIGRGLCVLIGISRDDTEADRDYMQVFYFVFLKLFLNILFLDVTKF